MRTAEEPLRSDLNVAGLKAQVLGCLEALEAREREREEIIAEITAMAEEHGLDVGAVKAVVGSWKGPVREYFYSFFDPNPRQTVALGDAL